ncbi:MAG: DUF58 domain-containing protein [Anaerolineae bacterium]|nr:DUF58 domain-containing protein [Anaerolineae bacterium]
MLHQRSAFLSQVAKNMFTVGGVIYHYQGDHHESTVRLTERIPLVMAVAQIVLLIFFPARVWIVMLVAMVLLVAICAWWAIQGARLTRFDRRLLHTWAQIGDRLEETFVLQNGFLLPLLTAEIIDHSNLPGYDASVVRSISGFDHDRWSRKSISSRRGVFRVGPTTVRFGDPFGIFEVTCEYPQAHEVLVVPPILHDLGVLAPPGGGHGVAASRQRNLIATGIIGGVRDYHPGDPVRRIHWPLSMRHQDFLVKEFDDEKGGNIWLVLDLDSAVHVGEGQESTLEYAIIWTASWAWHLLKQGKGVGLYTSKPDRIVLQPARGKAQLNHILRALAPLETHAEIPLSEILREARSFLAHGHSIIIITPSITTDWPTALMHLDLGTSVKGIVLLDAETFPSTSDGLLHDAAGVKKGDDPDVPMLPIGQERTAWLRAILANIGIPVHLVQYQHTLDARPSAPGSGDWDYIVTPWGKVVVRSSPAKVNP